MESKLLGVPCCSAPPWFRRCPLRRQHRPLRHAWQPTYPAGGTSPNPAVSLRRMTRIPSRRRRPFGWRKRRLLSSLRPQAMPEDSRPRCRDGPPTSSTETGTPGSPDWYGERNKWIDGADLVFYSGHASSTGWSLWSKEDHSRAVSTNSLYAGHFGGRDLEWLVIDGCGPLQDKHIDGGHGNALNRWDRPSAGCTSCWGSPPNAWTNPIRANYSRPLPWGTDRHRFMVLGHHPASGFRCVGRRHVRLFRRWHAR